MFVGLFVIAGRDLAYSGPQCWDRREVQCACPGDTWGIGWCMWVCVCDVQGEEG